MQAFFFLISPSTFGPFGLVWQEMDTGPLLQQVFLPRAENRMEDIVQETFPGSLLSASPPILELSKQIRCFMTGEVVDFDLRGINLNRCSEFQVRVLLAEYEIPRGWVSSYGKIARKLDLPGGARAVGSALARNPFPIIIPCHRAVRSDGLLGGYQGGLKMKRGLLESEGIEFSNDGKVLAKNMYY